MEEKRLSIIQPKKSRTLARRLEKFYTTATAKDKKKALEELTPDERKFLLMSHAVGEDRLTGKIMTILIAAVVLCSLTGIVPFVSPYLGSILPYPAQNIFVGFLFLVWLASAITGLVIAGIYLEPVIRGNFRAMLNSIGSAKILETDRLITPTQAEAIVEEQSAPGLFARLSASLTEKFASGVSLKRHQINIKEPKQREPGEAAA